MKFNSHLDLEGVHAFLAPSGYHWVNYDEERLIDRYETHKASMIGTELHELAAKLIEKNIGNKYLMPNKNIKILVNKNQIFFEGKL